jgi:carboxylate-amine ligase
VQGTLELRVPDTQVTLADAEAVAAVAHALVARLVERHDAGEPLPVAPSWRIGENRASAFVHGVAGTMRDLVTGEHVATADRVAALLEELTPVAARLGCSAGLAGARELLAVGGGARRQRDAAGDARAATAWLAERYAG